MEKLQWNAKMHPVWTEKLKKTRTEKLNRKFGWSSQNLTRIISPQNQGKEKFYSVLLKESEDVFRIIHFYVYCNIFMTIKHILSAYSMKASFRHENK